MKGRVAHVTLQAMPQLPEQAPGVLPDWAAQAARQPATRPWAENQHRFAVRVSDDAGAEGWFGPVSASVAAIVRDELSPVVLGLDSAAWRPAARLSLAGRHQRGAHARLAISALELALWDLRSRAAGAIVGDLLGGRVRSTIPAYATALGLDVDHPLAADIAAWIAGAGFWAQKWGLPGYSRGEPASADARRLKRLREAVGDQARICVDAIGEWDASYSRQMLPALAECGVAWVEEPGPVTAPELAGFGLAYAAGEHVYDLADQLRRLVSGSVHVWQPDVTWNGGLAASVGVAELAAALSIPCFPHGAGLAAGLHLASVMPGRAVPAVEYHLTMEPLRQAAFEEPLLPDSGVFKLTSSPGLTAHVRTYDTSPAWENRHAA